MIFPLHIARNRRVHRAMIRKVPRITSFGVFNDFAWPNELHEFKQFNLLYGWNYSGKTTFSRALRCFELLKRHPDFPAAEVQLHCEGGTIHKLSTSTGPHHYRVFNADFIRDNIFFDEGAAEPILIIGAADEAKERELREKQDEAKALEGELQTLEASRRRVEADLDRALIASARDTIKNPLNRLNYDKNKFSAAVEACKDEPEKYRLADSEYQQALAIYNSNDRREPISSGPRTALVSLATLASSVAEISSRVVQSVTIQAVAEDPKLERWVNEGRSLHIGKDSCQFCGNPLPHDLLSRLGGHFSSQYDKLMVDLTALEIDLNKAKSQSPQLPQAGDFYADLATSIREVEVRLEQLLGERRASLDALISAVLAKKVKAFSALPCPTIRDNAPEISTAVDKVIELIMVHNERSSKFAQSREEAFISLERHCASQFAIDQDYAGKLELIERLNREKGNKQDAVSSLRADIAELEGELSEAVRGAETINRLMRAYFGKDDLRIAVGDDKRFRITRSGSVAKNLSEGERSAIAFVHFMTKLFDDKHPLHETTVVVDDPICSLDANHLFNTFSFLKTKLSACHQLFILTHNYEFYSLLKEWALDEEGQSKKDQKDWKKWSIYIVRRKDDGTSTIEVIPPELLRFKSEYHYLFATLLRFRSAPGSEYDYLYSLPNVTRRFMEAFGGIMIPTFARLRSKLPRIIPDEVQRERVWKFINHYSHNNSLNRSLVLPDVSECKSVVDACLNAVEQWNTEYYRDLVGSVQ